MEGMRVKAGLPLYESGHATHLYGPLLSVILSGIFCLTGLNLLAARIVFAVFGLMLVASLTAYLCGRALRPHWLIAALLFLAINLRTNFVFLTAQPDCLAAFLALAALVLWITRRHSRPRLAFSLVLFLVAMLTKQTSAAFALIPCAHVLIWPRRNKSSAFARSALPPSFLVFSLLVIRVLHPALFEGIVLIPGALKVHYERAFSMAIFLFATFPIFFLALVMMLSRSNRIAARERWILSSIAVLVPIGIWTIIKSGGGFNSLLFAYLSMTALAVSQLDPIARWIEASSGWRAFFASGVVALAILCSFFFQPEKSAAVLLGRSGDEKYATAVEVARRLGHGVITPQDPTIAFRANGFFGRALFFELDTHSVKGEWPPDLPEGMQRELSQSAYLLTVDTHVPSPLTPALLTRNGFQLLSVPELQDSAYALWAKAD